MKAVSPPCGGCFSYSICKRRPCFAAPQQCHRQLILKVLPECENEAKTLRRLIVRQRSETGRAAAEGSGISGLQLCHTKWFTDGTSKPEPGLEAKWALAPGKSPHSSSRRSLGSSGSALVPPHESTPASDPRTSLPMARHQPFGVCDVEFCSVERLSKCCICPGTCRALRCQGSVCRRGRQRWPRHDCAI